MRNERNSPLRPMKEWSKKVTPHLPIPHALNQSFIGLDQNPNHPNERQPGKPNQKESCNDQDSMKKMKPT